MSIKQIRIKANAKINLALDILGRREDGYHLVKMVMQSVDLQDIITVSRSNNKKILLTTKYPFPGNIKNNTAYLAAQEFFDHTKRYNEGITIHIQKNIPICAGLAGGSADAAAVILALDQMFNTNLNLEQLKLIGSKIGADVPFCISGGTMLSEGIGTDLSDFPDMPDCFILLAKPNISVSTQEAYDKSDAIGFSDGSDINNLIQAVKLRNIDLISKNLYNRFEKVLNLSEVENIKQTMLEYGALGSSMSGSGPTVFGIFQEYNNAEKCLLNLKKYYKDVYICNPIKQGCIIE